MAQDVFGYTALQVIPVIQGAAGALEGQLSGPMQSAGRAAGQAAGRAVASGLEAAQADVERASAALAAARDKEADAAGKVRVAEAKLQELRDRGNTSASQLARAEEALATAQRNADRSGRARQAAVQNLSDARSRLANTTDEAAESESRFSRAISSINDRIGPAAKQMAGLAIAAAGVGTAMDTVTEAMSRDKSTDILAAQLGASPQVAAEYGAVAANLYKQGLGEGFDDVTSAVGAVTSAFATLGSEGEASLEQVTAKALNFQAVFGTETQEAVQTASNLVVNGLAKDSTEAFDLLTTAFQRVPAAMRDELPEILNEYSTHFNNLGFSGEQAFALLVDYSRQGKFALDKAGDALKEFTLLGSDMSESSQEAYKKIGLDAQAMSDAIASGGPAAQDALQKVASGLLTITEPADLANTAIALFGTPIEDLSIDKIPAFLQALTGGSESMTGFAGSADQMGQTVGDNAANKIEILKRSIQDGLVNALTSSVEWIERNQTTATIFAGVIATLGVALVGAKVAAMGYAIAQGVMAAASGTGAAALAGNTLALGAYTIAAGVIRGATVAWSAVQWVLNAALSANPIGLVVVAIGALIAGIVLAYQNSETFRDIVQACWEAIKVAALWTWENVLKPVFDYIVGGYKLAWEAAKTAGEAIGAAWQWISDKATEAKDWVVNAFNTVVDFVTGLPGRVRSAAAGLWDGITDGFRAAINWLISAWNNFRLGFDFTIPVIDKHVSFTIDTPDLPLLAGGGIAGRTSAGRLWGPGTGTSDSILGIDKLTGIPTAFVSNREGVVTESAMDNGGAELVAALNAGWVPPLDMLRAMLPGLAGGGLVSKDQLRDFARGIEGAEYAWGGWGNSWNTDCSGAASALANYATQQLPAGQGTRSGTGNMAGFLSDLGAQSGVGPDGSLQFGWMNGGPYGGHIAMKLPTGEFVEMGGERGNGQFAGNAKGPLDAMFTEHAFFPPEFFLGGDLGGGGSAGSGLGSGALGGGSGLGAGGSGLGSGAGGSGGSAPGGSSARPEGQAVPVWVDNWPSNSGSSGSTAGAAPGSSALPSDPAAPSSTGVDEQFDQPAAIRAALDKANSGLLGVLDTAVRGQLDATPFGETIKGVEKQGKTINIIVADIYEAMNVVRREEARSSAAAGSRF